MKMYTAKLIETIDAEMVRIREAHEAKHAKVVATCNNAAAEWLASDKPEKLRVAARAVLEKLRRGKTVTRDDVRAFERWENVYQGSATAPAKSEPNYGNLPQLRAFLETVADETVTHSALTQVGFRRLDNLTRLAVQA